MKMAKRMLPAAVLLYLAVPAAHGQDLVSSSTLPSVFFDDTNDEDCTPSYDWRIITSGGASALDTNNFFYITGVGEDPTGPCAQDVPILLITHNGSTRGDVGINGTPTAATLHIKDTDPQKNERVLTRLTGTTFAPQFEYENGGTGKIWRIGMNPADSFVINQMDDPTIAEMRIDAAGKVFVNGSQVHPDYVFEPGYELMKLAELERFVTENKHLPGVVSAGEAEGQIELTRLPLQLLEKIEELTLYTFEQQAELERLQAAKSESDLRLDALSARLAELEEKIAR